MDMGLGRLWQLVIDGRPDVLLRFMGVAELDTTELN